MTRVNDASENAEVLPVGERSKQEYMACKSAGDHVHEQDDHTHEHDDHTDEH
jgi:hypothetical protein